MLFYKITFDCSPQVSCLQDRFVLVTGGQLGIGEAPSSHMSVVLHE